MSKSSNSNELQMIHVTWVDSVGTEGWVNDHKNSNMNCETTGFFISENEEMVKVALNKSHVGADMYGDYIEIPKVAIKGRRWVR